MSKFQHRITVLTNKGTTHSFTNYSDNSSAISKVSIMYMTKNNYSLTGFHSIPQHDKVNASITDNLTPDNKSV
jgi:dTDP-4-dehydrorhamnose 3,5-epimerase-like enzyme